MGSFRYSFSVQVDDEDYFYQHVIFEEVDGGLEIRCEAPDSDCVHLLHPERYEAFKAAIGQSDVGDVLDAVRRAVKRRKRRLIFEAVHDYAEVKFTWFSID